MRASGWPAREVADPLDDSVPAVNSAPQRARERINREQRAGTLARLHAPAFEGAPAVGEFFATEPLGGHIERIALVPPRAGERPGFACYAGEHATGRHDAYGVMVLALRGDRIAGITGFPQDLELLEQLGVPLALTR